VTNELEYNGRTEPRGRTFGRKRSTAPEPERQPKHFQLPNGVFDRAASLGTRGKFSGNDVVNVICAVAAHINARTGKTYVSSGTVAIETDLPPKIVEAIITRAEDSGILQPGTWNGKTTHSFIPHDADGDGYRLVNLQWWNENAALGKSRGLLQHLLAIADGKRRFTAKVKELLPILGLSRTEFYRLLAPLKGCDLVRTRQQGRHATEFEMPCVPRKKQPQGVPAEARGVPTESRGVPRMPRGVPTDPPEPAPVAAFGTEGLRSSRVTQCNVTRSTPQDPHQISDAQKTRAVAAALGPVGSPSQDQEPPKPAAVETVEACTERMLAKIGVKLNPPPEPEPKPKVKSAVQLLMEQGWIITTDGGWRCAEKPGEHNCEDGLIVAPDERGHKFTMRCRVCLDAARQEQAQPEERADSTAIGSGHGVMEMCRELFGAALGMRQLTAGSRTIEAEWAEPKPAAQLQLSAGSPERRRPQRDAGEALPPKMYADCRKWIGVNTDTRPESWSGETSRQIDKMLRWSGVARYGAEALRVELVEAKRERWSTNHGHCHDGPCDGSCGHDRDECDGHVVNLTDAGVLDLVGCAIYSLTGDEHYGRSDDNGCPNAVRERMYAA
jgi:hypothetical protein